MNSPLSFGSLARKATACGAVLLASAAHAQFYSVTDLTALVANSEGGSASGINANGAVVGNYSVGGVTQGFVYQGGVIQAVGPAGALPSKINLSGQIVGNIYDFSQPVPTQGYLLNGGTFTNLSMQPGAQKGTYAADINNSGLVSGGVYTQANLSGVHYLAGLYNGTSWTTIGTLKGDTDSAAAAMNNLGEVVGYSATISTQRGFIYSGGVMSQLESLIPQGAATPSAINDAGMVAGSAEVSTGGQHAVYWEGGTIHDLGTLGGTGSIANGINLAGDIVGDADILAGNQGHAFIDRAGVMLDLNSLLVGPSGFSYLQEAFAINDAGMIVGDGVMADGSVHAFLLSPVPEPSQWAMLLVSIPLVGVVATRRRKIANQR